MQLKNTSLFLCNFHSSHCYRHFYSVLIKNTEDTLEKMMWRQNREIVSVTDKECSQPPGAAKTRNRFSLKDCTGNATPPTTQFYIWLSDLSVNKVDEVKKKKKKTVKATSCIFHLLNRTIVISFTTSNYTLYLHHCNLGIVLLHLNIFERIFLSVNTDIPLYFGLIIFLHKYMYEYMGDVFYINIYLAWAHYL